MEAMSTPPAKTPAKTQKPIKPPGVESRFAGLAWMKDGIAVATTDGRWMTARATSLQEAARLIESAEDPKERERLPTRGAARLFRDADGNDIRGTMTIDAATKPEEAPAQRARDHRETEVQSAEAELVKAEARLAETLAKPKHLRKNGITKTELEVRREEVSKAKMKLRDARMSYDVREDQITCNGVSFCLSLVRAALRSLGEMRATLDVSSPRDPGVLRTATGIGVVMPLKPEAL